MQFITSKIQENEVLTRVNKVISPISEMSKSEKEFLNSLILRFKPKKILEVGVSAGASAAIILNAIKDNKDAFLYSEDYNECWYHDHNKKSGFIIEDNFSEFLPKWKIFRGGLTLNYLDQIGPDIDFVFLDTVHHNPGEILDFLMILPYVKKNAVVVFHDISLQTFPLNYDNTIEFFDVMGNNALLPEQYEHAFIPNISSISYTNCLLLSAIKGEVILPDTSESLFPNIGAIILDDNIRDYIYSVFNLLLMDWSYKLNELEVVQLSLHFSRFYDKSLVDFFVKVVNYQHTRLDKVHELAEQKQKIADSADLLQKNTNSVNLVKDEIIAEIQNIVKRQDMVNETLKNNNYIMKTQIFYLFKVIPIYKIKGNSFKKKHYLLAFIPVFKTRTNESVQ